MIRIATKDDVDLILSMCLKFVMHTHYKDLYNEDQIRAVIEECISDTPNKIVILYGDVGMIGGITSRFAFGSDLVATELAWWVEPDARVKEVGTKLLEAFEYWAKNIAGCKGISMVSLDDRLGQFYEKNGYALYERAYFKVL